NPGQSTQEVVIGVETVGRLMLSALDLGLLQLRRDRPYDAHSHLILQIENVLEIAFKALRPEMYACRGINELNRRCAPDWRLCARFPRVRSAPRAHARPASRRPPGPCR